MQFHHSFILMTAAFCQCKDFVCIIHAVLSILELEWQTFWMCHKFLFGTVVPVELGFGCGWLDSQSYLLDSFVDKCIHSGFVSFGIVLVGLAMDGSTISSTTSFANSFADGTTGSTTSFVFSFAYKPPPPPILRLAWTISYVIGYAIGLSVAFAAGFATIFTVAFWARSHSCLFCSWHGLSLGRRCQHCQHHHRSKCFGSQCSGLKEDGEVGLTIGQTVGFNVEVHVGLVVRVEDGAVE